MFFLKRNNCFVASLILDNDVVRLYYLDYPYVLIKKNLLIKAVTENKNVCVNITTEEEPKLIYGTGLIEFALITEESYTDNLDHQHLSYINIPFNEELIEFLKT